MLSYDTEGNVNGGEFRVDSKNDSEDDDDDEDEEEKVKSKVDSEDEDESEDEEDADANAGDQEVDSDDNDSLDDLRLKDSDHEEEESEGEEEIQDAAQSKPEKKLIAAAAVPDFKQLKDMMEQARKELPFTYAGNFNLAYYILHNLSNCFELASEH